jgi:hypothetical protein
MANVAEPADCRETATENRALPLEAIELGVGIGKL